MEEVRAVRRAPGVILGLGFGGFADGIVLHQIAQWHNMGSAILPPTTMEAMKRNMMWDGWFHVATLVLCLAGVFMLLGLARRNHELPTPRMLVGQMVSGWGTSISGRASSTTTCSDCTTCATCRHTYPSTTICFSGWREAD